MGVRLLVFDLDGTLVDSRRDLAESANAVLAEHGCRQHSEDAIARMVGDGAATLVRRAFEQADCAPPPGALDRFLAIYNSRLLKHTRAYPGIPELLSALEPRVAMAVLTNKPLAATRAILTGLSLDRFFGDDVLGGDGPQPRKPDPAGLLALMAKGGVRPDETMLVGDSHVDWETARNACTRVCLARYGFGFEGIPMEQLSDGDRVIAEPLELLKDTL